MNFAKIIRKVFLIEDLRLLLLDVLNSIYFNALHILIVILKIKTRNIIWGYLAEITGNLIVKLDFYFLLFLRLHYNSVKNPFIINRRNCPKVFYSEVALRKTCVALSFLGFRSGTLLKRDSDTAFFLQILLNF